MLIIVLIFHRQIWDRRVPICPVHLLWQTLDKGMISFFAMSFVKNNIQAIKVTLLYLICHFSKPAVSLNSVKDKKNLTNCSLIF